MFETVHLIKRVELEIETVGAGTLNIATDQPGDNLQLAFAASFDTEATTSARRTERFTMQGNTRAKLIQATLFATTSLILYGARVLARPLGVPGVSGWQWYSLPVRVTEEMYRVAEAPIRPTAENYGGAGLPIRATPEAFAEGGLPIRPTTEEWTRGPLPLPATSPIPKWIPIPVDVIK